MLTTSINIPKHLNYKEYLNNIRIFYITIEIILSIPIQEEPVLIGINAIVACVIGFVGRGWRVCNTVIVGYIGALSAGYLILDPSQHIIRYILYIITIYGNYSIIYRLLIDNLAKSRLITALLFVGLFQTVLCASEAIFGINPILLALGLESPLFSSEGRVSGLLGHPIPSALLAVVCIIIALPLRKKNPKLCAGLLISNGVVILLTQSRSAYVALAVASAAVILALMFSSGYPRNRKYIVFILAVVILLLIVVFLLIVNQFPQSSVYKLTVARIVSLFSPEGSGSLVQRMGSLNFIIEYIASHFADPRMWLGYGYGELADYVIRNDIWFTTPGFYTIDNQYITLLFDIGIINFVALIAIFARQLFRLFRLSRAVTAGNEVLSSIALMVSCAVVAYFFEVTSWIGCLVLFPAVFAHAASIAITPLRKLTNARN